METPTPKSLKEIAQEASDSLTDIYSKLSDKVDFTDYPEFSEECEYIKGQLATIKKSKVSYIKEALREIAVKLFAYLRSKELTINLEKNKKFDPKVLQLAQEFGELHSMFDDIEDDSGILFVEEPEALSPDSEKGGLQQLHEQDVESLRRQLKVWRYAFAFVVGFLLVPCGGGTYYGCNSLMKWMDNDKKVVKSNLKREECEFNLKERKSEAEYLRKKIKKLEKAIRQKKK